MFPQSELDNYKLQVELLQEKLKRSEDNRQQLEHQLEHILHKRNELEKSSRLKTRQKYQEFLDEQRKRNERNKMLMQMLERIDEQTSALSARSERLKMMKMQYEMYFAKLVQSQTLRCIQAPPPPPAVAATAIPVLLPSSAAAAVTSATQPSAGTNAKTTPTVPASATTTTPLTTNVDQKLPPSNATDIQQQQQWTLAMATPTPAGMLLSTGGATPTALPMHANYIMQPPAMSPYDAYLHQYPLAAYMPHSPRLMAAHAAAAAAAAAAVAVNGNVPGNFIDFNNFNNNTNNTSHMQRSANDIYQRPDVNSVYNNNNNDFVTLRDFDKMTNAMAPLAALAKAKTIDDDRQVDELNATLSRAPSTVTTNDTTSAKFEMREPQKWRLKTEDDDDDNNNNNNSNKSKESRDDAKTSWQLSSMSTTTATTTATPSPTTATTPTPTTSSMAFDKLPKSLLTRTKENIARIDAALGSAGSPTATIASTPAMTPLLSDKRNDDMAAALAAAMKPQIEFSASAYAPLPSTAAAAATAPGGGGGGAGGVRGDDSKNAPLTTASRQKIDAPLPPPTKPTSMLNGTTSGGSDGNLDGGGGGVVDYTSPAAVDDWLGGRDYEIPPPKQIPTPTAGDAGGGGAGKPSKPLQSIEYIENAIYGEVVQPPATVMESSAKMRSVTQGVLDDFLAQQEQRELPDPTQPAADYAATYASIGGTDGTGVTPGAGDDTTISSMSYGEQEPNSEPTYATIDNVTNNNNNNNNTPDAYQTGEGVAATAVAVDEYGMQHPTDDQLAANGMSTDQQQQQQQQQQAQEYDYSNYNASEYDPNAYPGYTYDEATGQYIPDATTSEEQQQQQQIYGDNDAYAEQMKAYEQQQQQQQDQYNEGNYDYSNYEQQQQPSETPAAATASASDATAAGSTVAGATGGATDEVAPNYDETATNELLAPAGSATTPPAAAAAAVAKKTPTSILSTAAASSSDAKKQKKRVNFVDSSETDESARGPAVAAAPAPGSESDFDFSVSEQQQ